MVDADGYGYKRDERGLARLLEDMRTLSPAGIARVADGWDTHAAGESAHERFHEAEKAALHQMEAGNLAEAWEDTRRQILDLTEGRGAMNDWKAEHGEIGHKAESAALGAALAITASGLLTGTQYRTLVAPMAEALPWLVLAE